MISSWRRLSRVQRFTLGASAFYCALFLLVLALRPGNAESYKNFQNFYQMLPPLFGAVCHLRFAALGRGLPRVRRLAFVCLGLSCFSFLLGQVAWTYYETIRDIEVPFPGWPDVWYLTAFPLLGLGIVLLFGLSSPWTRMRLVMDGAIASSSVGIVSWYFLVSGWWAKSGLTEAGKFVIAAYPLCDIALIFGAITFLCGAYADRENRASTVALAGGVCLMVTADTLFSYYTLNEWYHTGSWFDWGYSFGWLLIGYAGLLPLWKQQSERKDTSMQQEAQDETREDDIVSHDGHAWSLPWITRFLLPYLLAFGAWGVVTYHDYSSDHLISTSTYVWGLWLMILVAGRQVFTMLHNQHLTHQLRVLNRDLEHTVAERTQQIRSLFELTKAVNNSLQAEHVLDTALIYTPQGLGAQAVAIRLCETDECTSGMSFLERGLSDRPALVEWLQQCALAREGASEMALLHDEEVALLRAPLRWREAVLGDIAVVRDGAQPFSKAEREMLESIGFEVAAAYRNAQIHAVAVEHADRDSVTGLFNHRAIHQRLQSELDRAARTKRAVTVIMMDLNNFKLFNDTYGHPVGDQVLKRVATALSSKCRKFDILGRYGGDEFIAVLPETDLSLAMTIAQRWRDRMELEGFHLEGEERTIPISLSFGIASFPTDSTNRFELISIADANLYAAKLSEKGIVATSEVQRQNRQLKAESSFDVLDAMVTAVDNKDSYTRRHSEDVTEFALWIADELGLSQGAQRVVRLAGLLHDVGKIGVPESVLKKPGRLTDEEFSVMKSHAQFGAFIVGGVPGMEEILPGVKSHHERWDGRGYPDGLAGEAIPFLGRLLAVADACSAMTTSRPYRQALDWEAAMKEIEKNIGTQFDPDIAKAFLRAARKRRAAATEGKAPHLQLVSGPKFAA